MDAVIQPHQAKAAAVWNSGGAQYDEISRGIADAIEHAVLRLDPQPGERILDLATGTGWTSRAVCRRGATVTGVDIGQELLATARERARSEGLAIDYQVGDAEALAFEDGAFDAVISTFGIMFAARPEIAAAELGRVCRPGGRIVLATWATDGNVFEMFKVMKAFMAPPPASPPPSPFEWGSQTRVRVLLGDMFDLRFEPAISYYREATAGCGMGQVLHRVWTDPRTGRVPRRRSPGRIGARLHRFPRRLQDRTRNLRPAHPIW